MIEGYKKSWEHPEHRTSCIQVLHILITPAVAIDPIPSIYQAKKRVTKYLAMCRLYWELEMSELLGMRAWQTVRDEERENILRHIVIKFGRRSFSNFWDISVHTDMALYSWLQVVKSGIYTYYKIREVSYSYITHDTLSSLDLCQLKLRGFTHSPTNREGGGGRTLWLLLLLLLTLFLCFVVVAWRTKRTKQMTNKLTS